MPVDAGEGDVVLAGSIDLDGALTLEVTKIGGETTLGKIVALMHKAERAKPPVTRLLEAYSGHYMVLILLVAAGVWFATANTAADMLAVLVASCPCALVLAAPRNGRRRHRRRRPSWHSDQELRFPRTACRSHLGRRRQDGHGDNGRVETDGRPARRWRFH